MAEAAARFSAATRIAKRWIARSAPGGCGNFQDRQRTGRPRQGTAEHAAWIYAVGVAETPAQGQFACALGTAQRVRPAWLDRGGLALGLRPGRRSLRRLGLLPQRSQRRACRSRPGPGRRWQEREFPASARRGRGRPRFPLRPRADLGRAGPARGSAGPGGPRAARTAGPATRGLRAGQPRNMPGIPGAARPGASPASAAGRGPRQPDRGSRNPGVAGGARGGDRAPSSAGLLAGDGSCGTAAGVGPAQGKSLGPQDASAAPRRLGSRLASPARVAGTGAVVPARSGAASWTRPPAVPGPSSPAPGHRLQQWPLQEGSLPGRHSRSLSLGKSKPCAAVPRSLCA